MRRKTLSATNAGYTTTRNIHVQPRTNPHTHLAAVTCVVSCRRLAASLSRLASRCCGVGCVRCRLSASLSRLAARCCGVGSVRCRLSASLSRLARSLCVCVCVCVYVCDHSCAFCTLPCPSCVPYRAYDLFNAPFCPCSIGLPPTPSGSPLTTNSSDPLKLLVVIVVVVSWVVTRLFLLFLQLSIHRRRVSKVAYPGFFLELLSRFIPGL